MSQLEQWSFFRNTTVDSYTAASAENSDYTLDLNHNQYAIWASGGVNNGPPAFHTTYFGSSVDAINIRFEPGLVSVH